MEEFYSKGYVCYLRASQMNDLIEKSVYDEHELGVLKKLRRPMRKYRVNMIVKFTIRIMD